MSVDDLRAQYEAYPYPARNPADESKRLITGSPSHLDELVQHVFGGRIDHARPLRVLVAGGGTGDGAIMLAQQMADAGNPGRITYIDLSDASRAVAQARAEARGLTNIDFRRGSLLELDEATAEAGPFDYIDCCGVLHHLDEPSAGLRSLAEALAPGGGIGIMVYAPLGRTGVYPMQEALRGMTEGLPPAEKVALARRLIQALPPSNWLLNNPHISDHRLADANLYDLLLHSCDRPYSVPQLAELADSAGLAVASLIDPLRYEPSLWIKDAKLLKRLEGMDRLERAAWTERITGAFTKHIAYLLRPADLEAARIGPDDPEVVPVLRDVDGPTVAKGLPPGGSLEFDLMGSVVALPMPRLAGPILARIDGRTSLGALHAAIEPTAKVTWDQFLTQFRQLFHALGGLGKMHLRRE
ncbi:class I SAM-dependent methyltransferase [Azospirillum picis]|uniref:2-polyprenyl-3-methyl-5-hydroxy-6-metoxy-1, 4-benzoquinol methylase n=1 Tax=Azospirillum picis TaxID=488438 RepID=A0ABU0MJX6_9PROT|nr:class I SAM-dependent methyltransferase [Azospirillum picis]MBP2299993.1 2-polyprenyl-3-methyl-5-hydroxy-6-metoxy-1,4-benzoquinol methylase [Azospirillum picis]MDQ0533769.1 2-polyprenyl-3-methyl-5-hydroxy-6-metoxy-1,4-benzoquinol methylase [Azospirillum picis]